MNHSWRLATRKTNHRDVSPLPLLFYIPLNAALYLCLLSNGLAALHAPIQDCDEVFNFWEPAHFLDHGYGLQTWEYSPEYSIRSWLYVSLHATAAKISSWVVRGKSAEFYAVRFCLAFFCAACETRLYSSICRTLNPRIGLFFLMIVAFSPGMFHASASFLPSSFTMCTSMLGFASYLDWHRRPKQTAQSIMWFGLGAIVGWPFAGALIGPLLVEEVVIGFTSESMMDTFYGFLNGAARCLAILVCHSGGNLTRIEQQQLTHFRNLHRQQKSQSTRHSSRNLRSCRGILSPITYSGAKVEVPTSSVLSHGHFIFEIFCSTSMRGFSSPCCPHHWSSSDRSVQPLCRQLCDPSHLLHPSIHG